VHYELTAKKCSLWTHPRDQQKILRDVWLWKEYHLSLICVKLEDSSDVSFDHFALIRLCASVKTYHINVWFFSDTLIQILFLKRRWRMLWWMCVCVKERERERVCVCVCACKYIRWCYHSILPILNKVCMSLILITTIEPLLICCLFSNSCGWNYCFVTKMFAPVFWKHLAHFNHPYSLSTFCT
jgi:hypothetical protein